MRGINWSPMNSLHKGQWRGALMYSLIYPWTNGWANHRYSGDQRRHRAHYDVTVMILPNMNTCLMKLYPGQLLSQGCAFMRDTKLSIWVLNHVHTRMEMGSYQYVVTNIIFPYTIPVVSMWKQAAKYRPKICYHIFGDIDIFRLSVIQQNSTQNYERATKHSQSLASLISNVSSDGVL